MIRIIKRKHIDDERWNSLIASSVDETIYPYTWYLDACADNWIGIVMNDYECIMPVAYRTKMGVRYTYQPIYCQQLGVYAANKVDPEIIRMFLHTLKKHFKMGDYSFNEGNLLGDEAGYEVSDSNNYVLYLGENTGCIRKNYTENCRRNIKRAIHSRLEFTDNISVDEIVNLKRITAEEERSPEHYTYAKNLFKSLERKGKIKIVGIRDDSHLMAAAIFAFSNKRAVFLLSASSDCGKEQRSMFTIVDQFIQMNAGNDVKLDFEGSNIASIARFFRGFGAKPEIYQRVQFENPVNRIVKKLKGV